MTSLFHLRFKGLCFQAPGDVEAAAVYTLRLRPCGEFKMFVTAAVMMMMMIVTLRLDFVRCFDWRSDGKQLKQGCGGD